MTIKMKEITALPDGRVNPKNAAAYLGLHEKTLAVLRHKGKGPRYIKRGRIFYFIEDLDAWLKEGESWSTK
jgi:hypothetical protein